MLNFPKPIVSLDFETTGVDPSKDRIVQLSFIKIMPDGELIKKKHLINPQMLIPEESTKVHGINNEMVKDAPTFKQFSKGIQEFIQDCILAGYNIKKFDLPLLFEEFSRCNITWDPMDHEIYDVFEILNDKESRTLTWALMFYCNKTMEGAHDAENDVLATIEILTEQIRRYELTEAPKPKGIDLTGTFLLDEDGDYIYNIGSDKKGTKVKNDPGQGFAHWMLNKNFSSYIKHVTRKVINAVSNNKAIRV